MNLNLMGSKRPTIKKNGSKCYLDPTTIGLGQCIWVHFPSLMSLGNSLETNISSVIFQDLYMDSLIFYIDLLRIILSEIQLKTSQR